MTSKALQNCWTCKERKIGCDKSLPACQNCTRTNRLCQGYGLKLAWPDTKTDGRRKQKRYTAKSCQTSSLYIPLQEGLAFLNTTVLDLNGDVPSIRDLVDETSTELVAPGMSRSISFNSVILDNDGLLLSYYDSVLARMITTIDDDTNGFRTNILPLALSSSDESSKSILKATLALSSFHLFRSEDALQYKTAAIRSLAASLQSSTASRAAQIATCMMLCVYSVFDAADSSWPVHLQGAKSVLQSIPEGERTSFPFPFLSTWLDYHDVLSGYSQRSPAFHGNSAGDVMVPANEGDNCKIVGLLGCSPELLKLIGCTNHLRALHSRSLTHAQNYENMALASLIRRRLENLKQEVSFRIGQNAGTVDVGRIMRTAEFYRIGALFYLHQVAPDPATSVETIPVLVRTAFAFLDQMEICTSPWPLFMLACHVTSDIDRIRIFAILESMDRKRRIGNVQIIRGIIRTVWKHTDLSSGQKSPNDIDWRSLIDTRTAIPSFI